MDCTKVVGDEFVAFLALKSEGLLKHFSFVGFEPEILSVNLLKYFDLQMFLYSVSHVSKELLSEVGFEPTPSSEDQKSPLNPLSRDKAEP